MQVIPKHSLRNNKTPGNIRVANVHVRAGHKVDLAEAVGSKPPADRSERLHRTYVVTSGGDTGKPNWYVLDRLSVGSKDLQLTDVNRSVEEGRTHLSLVSLNAESIAVGQPWNYGGEGPTTTVQAVLQEHGLLYTSQGLGALTAGLTAAQAVADQVMTVDRELIAVALAQVPTRQPLLMAGWTGPRQI